MPSQVGAKTYSNTALSETKVGALGALTNAGYLLYNFIALNPDATSVTYVQFFAAAAADVTVGTTTPTFVLPLSPKSGVTFGLTMPREFRSAVTIACTATPTGNGAPATNAIVSFDYVAG